MKKTLLLVSLATSFFAATVSAEEIYFFRGGFDIFSTGMNKMAAELRSKNYNASSHSFMAWQGIANDIVRRSKEKKVSYPIVVAGHSFGADAVVEFANYLGQNGVSTDLVIGFDATKARTFTKGAKRVVNYRSSKIGPYVKGSGFRGSISHVDVSGYGANHFTIEQVDKVQELALKEITSTLKKRRR